MSDEAGKGPEGVEITAESLAAMNKAELLAAAQDLLAAREMADMSADLPAMMRAHGGYQPHGARRQLANAIPEFKRAAMEQLDVMDRNCRVTDPDTGELAPHPAIGIGRALVQAIYDAMTETLHPAA